MSRRRKRTFTVANIKVNNVVFQIEKDDVNNKSFLTYETTAWKTYRAGLSDDKKKVGINSTE